MFSGFKIAVVQIINIQQV